MNGGIAEIRNQRKNELPLIFPITPPARPKKNAMTTNSTGQTRSEQRSHRPDHGDDRDDDHQEVRDAGDDPDDHLEQDPRREGEDDGGENSRAERGAGLLHAPNVLRSAAHAARFRSAGSSASAMSSARRSASAGSRSATVMRRPGPLRTRKASPPRTAQPRASSACAV